MRNLVQIKELLSRHGPLEPQSESRWSGSVPLPGEVAQYYQQVGPVDITIPGYGNPYFLPSLANLWNEQEGYRYTPDGDTIQGWDAEWLVVADLGADPFIFDAASGTILHDYHGQGGWDPFVVFENIYVMAASLALVGTIVVEAGEELTGEDEFIKPEHLQAASTRLAEVLGSTREAEEALANLGWSAG